LEQRGVHVQRQTRAKLEFQLLKVGEFAAGAAGGEGLRQSRLVVFAFCICILVEAVDVTRMPAPVRGLVRGLLGWCPVCLLVPTRRWLMMSGWLRPTRGASQTKLALLGRREQTAVAYPIGLGREGAREAPTLTFRVIESEITETPFAQAGGES
jgi:hypothetical protein